MPILVHLTLEKNVKHILRTGIRKGKYGVYCLPVLPNYYASHQWLRELRRFKQGRFVAIHFRVPDDEMVWFGHYNRQHKYISANEAVSLLTQKIDPQGFELVILRAISAKEIHKVHVVPQVIGWRYSPGMRERGWCTCPVCVSRGEFRSQKKRLQPVRRIMSEEVK